jgi:hypothetical protein
MNYVHQEWGTAVERYAAEAGPWVGCSIDSGTFAWPTVATSALFRGQKVVLMPARDRLAPTLAVKRAGFPTAEAGMVFLRRFMTSLSWSAGAALRAKMWMEAGHFPGFGTGLGWHSPLMPIMSGPVHIHYLPDPADPRAWLALALFREGGTLDHAGYSFLSYYKILNVLFPQGPQQVDWINATIPLLRGPDIGARVAEISAANPDVGDYLYRSGRNANAHAWQQPIVDPDEVEDERRLYRALPVIIALASHAVEHEFGVAKLFTLMDEHLYELNGFKALLPRDLVNSMQQRGSIPREQLPAMPKLTICLWGCDAFPALQAMTTTATAAVEGRFQIACTSSSGAVQIIVVLDFPEERFVLDPLHHLQWIDTGSAEAAREIADTIRFQGELLGNGELEIWSSDDAAILGWKEAFMPVNMMPDVEANRRSVARWTQLAITREARG